MGAGAYICGEETSLLESLRASAGRCASSRRCRRIAGLFGKPTVINNVITFASVPIILERGAEFYQDFGMGRSRGTLPMQLAGNIKHGGLVESRLRRDACASCCTTTAAARLSGRPIRAVQVGGPLGAYLPESQFDTPLDYEAFAAIKGMLGHGGIVVFDDTRRHGRAGALCDGVLRHRVVRQVHALPHRLDARRRGDRPAGGRRERAPRRRRCCAICARP